MLSALGDRIAQTAAIIDAAMHQFLTDLRLFDQAEGWRGEGALSTAHWLAWRVGMDSGTARERVRAARALGDLPLIDDALRKGELSFSKVRAVTRVANAENEAQLLEVAQHSTAARLETVCRQLRQAEPAQPADSSAGSAAEPKRWMRLRECEDGMVRLEVKLTTAEAALVMKACETAARANEAPSGNRAEGLCALAERSLRGAEPEKAAPPVEVVFHVDAATLQGQTEEGNGVPAETARRLLCDSGIVPVLHDTDGRIIDAGRKRRTISAPLRRALQARDRGCTFPSCTNCITDGHHLRHWIDGGKTTLQNLVELCPHHHTLLHAGAFTMNRDEAGHLVCRTADGKPLEPAPSPAPIALPGLALLGQHVCTQAIEPATWLSAR